MDECPRCHHPLANHVGDECWTDTTGHPTDDPSRAACPCAWFAENDRARNAQIEPCTPESPCSEYNWMHTALFGECFFVVQS